MQSHLTPRHDNPTNVLLSMRMANRRITDQHQNQLAFPKQEVSQCYNHWYSQVWIQPVSKHVGEPTNTHNMLEFTSLKHINARTNQNLQVQSHPTPRHVINPINILQSLPMANMLAFASLEPANAITNWYPELQNKPTPKDVVEPTNTHNMLAFKSLETIDAAANWQSHVQSQPMPKYVIGSTNAVIYFWAYQCVNMMVFPMNKTLNAITSRHSQSTMPQSIGIHKLNEELITQGQSSNYRQVQYIS